MHWFLVDQMSINLPVTLVMTQRVHQLRVLLWSMQWAYWENIKNQFFHIVCNELTITEMDSWRGSGYVQCVFICLSVCNNVTNVLLCLFINPLTPTLLPYGYSYKASCACHTGLSRTSFVIFDILALWCSGLIVRVPGCQKLQTTA